MHDRNCFDIFQDSTRIYNLDESCLQLGPKTGKVVSFKGVKNVYEIAPGNEKSNLTFVGTFSASGEIVLPTIIFPYARIPKDILNNVPNNIAAKKTDSGWMNSLLFYEFITSDFNNYLEENKIQKPVLLFIDGASSHLTMQLSIKAEELQILLYILPPNTSHILQPADVGAFKPLKTYWRQAIHDFQSKNPSVNVHRRDVAVILAGVLQKITKETIINGFKACGIYPLNPRAVDHSKLLDVRIIHEDGTE